MNRIWIVEMLNDHYSIAKRKWEPTTGCALNREDARFQAKIWHGRNPDDKFRVRRYAAPSEGEKK